MNEENSKKFRRSAVEECRPELKHFRELAEMVNRNFRHRISNRAQEELN